MKIFLLLLSFSVAVTHCFTVPGARETLRYHNAVKFSDTKDNEANLEEIQEAWKQHLGSPEVRQARLEMVAKYVELGKTLDQAEKEVDEFLSDPEQSMKYLEMRRYTQLNQDLVGPELLAQLGGAFLVGLAVTVGSKYISVLKNGIPDGP